MKETVEVRKKTKIGQTAAVFKVDDIKPWNVEEERDDDNRKNEDEVEMSQIPNKGEYI